MKINQYKKIIKMRTLSLSIIIIAAVIFGIYDVFLASPEIKETSIFGFQTGIITSLGLFLLIIVIRYKALLKDDDNLLLQFNKENDERTKAIKAKAGIPMLPITSLIMIIIGVIAGYFNTLIFITLIVTAAVQMTICGIIKIIYMNKM